MRATPNVPIHLPSRVRPWLFLAALLSALALLACDDEDGTAPEGDAVIQSFTLTVTEGGIEPAEVRLRTPEVAVVVVENQSDESCEFSFGPYVRGFTVEPGDTFSMEFTAFAVDVELAAGGPLTMGCEDGEREGEIVLLDSTSP